MDSNLYSKLSVILDLMYAQYHIHTYFVDSTYIYVHHTTL